MSLKKESKFFICHATLSGEKVTGREVKCAGGPASVCAMGVLMERTMAHFSSLENKHLRREDEISGRGGGQQL